jgi:hypothetical protein
MASGKQILYFVGAGLSKSLEKPGKRIPLMHDFVQVMAEHSDSDDTILTTLAELENAKAFQYESDDCAKLARKVVGREADRSSATKIAFKTAFMSRRPESTEQLLAIALAKGPGADGPSGTPLLIRFNYAINKFFSLLGWEVDWDPLERFLRHQFRLYPPTSNQHTFVSFNYDLILDHAIQAIAEDNWNPFTGYGFHVRRYLECGKGRMAELPAWLQCPPGDRIRILKPHGSLSWLVPQAKSGQTGDPGYLLQDGPVCVPLAEHGEITYSGIIEPRAVFPTILAVCIIPPTEPAKRVNLGVIEKTRCLERLAIESADDVYVLGWSMPVTDQDQTCTIRCCVAERDKAFESITVINRGEQPEYFERIADTFGVTCSRLLIFNDGFSDYVEHCTG